MIKGVIIDIDGTLVDSNQVHSQAFEKAFLEKGLAIPASKIFPLIGMGGKILVSKLIGYPEDSSLVQKISKRHGEIFKKEFLPSLKAFPHTRKLILKMRSQGLKLVVGSSAKKDELEPLLQIAHVADLINERVSASDVRCPKPKPDIIFASLKKLQLPSNEVLMLGDTPYDITAAIEAGVKTVALLCGGWNPQVLQGAITIYKNPADLLAHFKTSPFAS